MHFKFSYIGGIRIFIEARNVSAGNKIAALRRLKLVAGAGFEPTTFGL